MHKVIEVYRDRKTKQYRATLVEIADDGTRRIMFQLRKPKLEDVNKAMAGYDATLAWVSGPTK
jgi:hypothetical protein